MAKNPDHIAKEIEGRLFPTLREDGFGMFRPKDLIRVTEHFVDHISFQLSRHGSKKFYVHYSKRLVCDPLFNLNSYSVGGRLSNNAINGDSTEWVGATAEGAKEGIESVLSAYEKTIRPWLCSISGIREYVFELIATNRNVSLNDFEFLVAFSSIGRRNRASWICDHHLESDESKDKETVALCREYKDAATIEYLEEIATNPKYKGYRDAFSHLPAPAATHKTVRDLLASWKKANIERHQLGKFIA